MKARGEKQFFYLLEEMDSDSKLLFMTEICIVGGILSTLVVKSVHSYPGEW